MGVHHKIKTATGAVLIGFTGTIRESTSLVTARMCFYNWCYDKYGLLVYTNTKTMDGCWYSKEIQSLSFFAAGCSPILPDFVSWALRLNR